MRKILFGLAVALVCVLAHSAQPASAAGLSEFVVSDYQIDFYLSKDAEGRSSLKTVEQITAEFSQANINHGIERFIPHTYDDHTTSLEINSVTDLNGTSRKYSTYESGDFLALRIGDADTYVHGTQTYIITYTQRDTTRYFADSNVDEFYWDTNGDEWKVPISALTARLHLDSALQAALTGNQSCYEGTRGSQNPCNITQTETGFTASVEGLIAYENMTIAVGFKPGTFAAFKKSTAKKITDWWALSNLVSGPAAAVALIYFLYRSHRKSNRLSEINTIVPEYIPPKDASVSVAGSITNKPGKVFAAQLVDLAVRHYIKIYQTREKSLFRMANYELEIIKDVADLKAEEKELLTDIFGTTAVGTKLDMKTLKNNYSVGRRLQDNLGKINKNIAGAYALRARDETQFSWFKSAAKLSALIGVVTLSPWLIGLALVAVIIAYTLKPLTDKGLELSRYLRGLEMYIKAAETDRLQMLQSPEGAEKLHAPVDTNDSRQLVKLYERVLPYAVLFGQEKEWNKQLSQYYEKLGETPTWYAGTNGAFNSAAFSTAISSFSQTSSYSSGSSGSSGGGSSGGGGGGGGGGGW